jgi:hypothetical protein
MRGPVDLGEPFAKGDEGSVEVRRHAERVGE